MDLTEWIEECEEIMRLERMGKKAERYSSKKWVNDRGSIENIEDFRNWLEVVDHCISPKNMDQAWEVYFEAESLMKHTLVR